MRWRMSRGTPGPESSTTSRTQPSRACAVISMTAGWRPRDPRGNPGPQRPRAWSAMVAAPTRPEWAAEAGRPRHVASFDALRRIESRPPAHHPAAIHRAAQHQHRGCVTVIGAAVAVLLDGAAELGHREHDDATHALAQVLRKCGEGSAQPGEPG